jgi:hypothetical protein
MSMLTGSATAETSASANTCEEQVGTDEIIGNWLKTPSVVVEEWVVFIYS